MKLTRERFIVTSPGKAPRRMDGKPLTWADREIVAGRDPLAAQIAAQEKADATAGIAD